MSLASLGPWSLGSNARPRCAPMSSPSSAVDGALTYAELLAACAICPHHVAARRSRVCRPGSTSPWRSMPVSLLAPLPFRWICASRDWRLAGAGQVIEAVGERRAGEGGGERCGAVGPHLGDDRRSAARCALARERAGQRARLCRGVGRFAWRSVALSLAAAPHRWADGAVALRDLWDHGGHRARGPFRHHRRFARSHPARATDRSSASAVAPRGAARRCGRGSLAARPCP